MKLEAGKYYSLIFGAATVGSEPIPKQTLIYERWVNVYEDGFALEHDSKESADSIAKYECSRRIACIHIYKEFTEGEGL